jgi:hypothetical protein
MYTCAGPLPAVGSLEATFASNFISLTWIPPFTLDITDVEPDISGYCIDVINSTTSSTLYSLCGINETIFSYPTPADSWCIVYTVYPASVVGNGTKATTTKYLTSEDKTIFLMLINYFSSTIQRIE